LGLIKPLGVTAEPSLKEVIDAQASGDVVQAYSVLPHAAGHMAMIANPLAEAIVKQFPAKYAI
jgi:hypothetical protein